LKEFPVALRTFICWYRGPDDAPADEIMSRYDLVVGAGCPPDRREPLRKLNSDIRFVIYMNAIDCRLPPTIEDVEYIGAGRPAAEHVRDVYEDVWRNHRDFLLKNAGGLRGVSADPRTIYAWGYQSPYDRTSRQANRFFLDPRSGWKDYFADMCAARMEEGGYDGVFVDNAAAGIHWNFDKLPDENLRVDIPDEEWSRAMSALLANVSRKVKAAKPGALAFANTCGHFVEPESKSLPAEGLRPTPFFRDSQLDGACEEFFAHAKGGNRPSYVTGRAWREQVRSILCCEAMGRSYLALSNGEENDAAARVYALASFLMGAGEQARFNFNPAAGPTYPLVYRLPEYDIDLGEPLVQYGSVDEARLHGTRDVYVRRFERGMALANPTNVPAEDIPVPAGAKRLVLASSINGGFTVEPAGSSTSLPPCTGEVMLYG
jgi:hypothetical protein